MQNLEACRWPRLGRKKTWKTDDFFCESSWDIFRSWFVQRRQRRPADLMLWRHRRHHVPQRHRLLRHRKVRRRRPRRIHFHQVLHELDRQEHETLIDISVIVLNLIAIITRKRGRMWIEWLSFPVMLFCIQARNRNFFFVTYKGNFKLFFCKKTRTQWTHEVSVWNIFFLGLHLNGHVLYEHQCLLQSWFHFTEHFFSN